jgi:hypothetical protein
MLIIEDRAICSNLTIPEHPRHLSYNYSIPRKIRDNVQNNDALIPRNRMDVCEEMYGFLWL